MENKSSENNTGEQLDSGCFEETYKYKRLTNMIKQFKL